MGTTARTVLSIGAAMALASACGGAVTPDVVVGNGERVHVALASAAATDDVVAATWRAGFVALTHGEGTGGAVVSPASLVVALAMLAEGATGDSAVALDAALGAGGDARTDAVNALTAEIARYEGDPAAVVAKELPELPVVHLADRVVVDDEQHVQPSYLDRLMSGYGAGVLITDLANATGKRALDAWVAEHSGGLVEESAIQPDPDLVLVLQNAVALAGRWSSAFDPDLTADQDFTLADGTVVQAALMREGAWFGYVEVDGWRAVRLPYADSANPSGLAADVILPPAGSAEAADPSSADPQQVADLVAALDTQEVSDVVVAMPTVDLTTSVDLLPVLTDLGLGALLAADTAGLDGMLVDPPGPPYVGQAVQQAVLRVDEEGTRAAAVTEIGMMAGSAPAQEPIVMTVDRPYLVAITDVRTGWPLFLATVLDPR